MHDQDTVRIPLRARDGTIRGYALIDAADAEWAKRFRWRIDGFGYAIAVIRMHRELLGLTTDDPRIGDHINRDTLDNRRGNLRAATGHESMQNRGSHKGSTSLHRGVYWHSAKQRWMATVQVNGKRTDLGRFKTEEAAAEAARSARARLMPFSVD